MERRDLLLYSLAIYTFLHTIILYSCKKLSNGHNKAENAEYGMKKDRRICDITTGTRMSHKTQNVIRIDALNVSKMDCT